MCAIHMHYNSYVYKFKKSHSNYPYSSNKLVRNPCFLLKPLLIIHIVLLYDLYTYTRNIYEVKYQDNF
ncbi:hypothetical protein FKM82_006420 [Ascaphus truei]